MIFRSLSILFCFGCICAAQQTNSFIIFGDTHYNSPNVNFKESILYELTLAAIEEQVDFVLAFWMVHEVPDKPAFFAEAERLLKPEAHLLLVEPKVHVTRMAFEQEVAQARAAGLKPVGAPPVAISWSALFALSDKSA